MEFPVERGTSRRPVIRWGPSFSVIRSETIRFSISEETRLGL